MTTKPSATFTWLLVGGLGLAYLASLTWFLVNNARAGDSAPWQLLTSGVLLSIPLILLYGSLGVLIYAARQRAGGELDPRLAKWIYWSPRLAGVLIIFFVSLFALDVFSEEYTPLEMLIGFFMHMLPSIVMAILLALAWRWEWIGMLAFLGGALFFSRFMLGTLGNAIGIFLLFVAPMLLIALLFGASWRWHARPQPPVAV